MFNNQNSNSNYIGLFIAVGVGIIALTILFIVLYAKAKKPHLSAIYFISGAVKTGKSAVMVTLGVFKYLSNLINHYLYRFIYKELIYFTFHRSKRSINRYEEEKKNKPILITNMPLRYIKWYPFTIDILLRKVRIPNRSVLLLDETSLIADSMLFTNKKINNDLLKFYKLWGHYSHGGTLICNSQSWSDNHFSLKRCMSRYLYIFDTKRFPLISISRCKELTYSEDNTSINIASKDIEKEGLMFMILPNFIFKLYDKYYLSAFTDSLAYYDKKGVKLGKRDSLKVKELVTLQDFKLGKVKENEEE